GAIKALEAPQPYQTLLFVWSREGKEMPSGLTTVRQRPLWRFFPIFQNDQPVDWVAWRWRDFFFDRGSPKAANSVGWQVHAKELDSPPHFWPLGHYPARRDEAKMREAFIGS